MNNPFIINNGLYVNADTEISGSAYVSGSLFVSGSHTRTQRLIVDGGTSVYMDSNVKTGINTWMVVDSFDMYMGNTAKWLLSINSGSNFKTSEMLAVWDPSVPEVNFAEYTTNEIGSVCMIMSVNISGGNVRLVANPPSGSWNIKSLRFIL